MTNLEVSWLLPIPHYAIVLAFAIIGGGLKFIDEAFDEDIFNRKAAIFLAPLLLITWILLSVADPISAVILFSILISVLLTGKIDNFVFKTSTTVLLLFFVFTGRFSALLIPALVLIAMGLLDERGNDYVDEYRANRAAEFFFMHRFSMKLGVLALCAASIFPWLYLFAFLTFDIAYDSVGIIGQKLAMMDINRTESFNMRKNFLLDKIY